eukprot:1945210-Rhodomonas_salina.1
MRSRYGATTASSSTGTAGSPRACSAIPGSDIAFLNRREQHIPELYQCQVRSPAFHRAKPDSGRHAVLTF